MVRRLGLRNARRGLGVAGLGVAALCLSATLYAPSGNLALVFLSLAYGGILFQQPSLCALCLDVGRKNAGAVFGFMNTAANIASALSAVVFVSTPSSMSAISVRGLLNRCTGSQPARGRSLRIRATSAYRLVM
jgi:hypothetical protein